MSGESPPRLLVLNGERTSVDNFLTTSSSTTTPATSGAGGQSAASSMVAVGQFLDTKSSLLSFGSCEYDHMYASVTETAASEHLSNEVRHLKELLLLHLDVIQQQSEQLVTKDKTISSLRQENETLRQRLERMDRRVSLQKARGGEGGGETVDNFVSTIVVGTISSNQQLILPLPAAHHSSDSPSTPTDSLLECDQSVIEPKRRRRGVVHLDVTTPVTSSSSTTLPPPPSSVTPTNTPVTRRKRSNSEPEAHGGRSSRRGRRNNIPILTTTQHYYTIAGTDRDLEEPILPADGVCEVPRWRVKTYEPSNLSTSGGAPIERLDDEVFAKRHLRHEQDERRRKRWDVQRLREQRQIEKLKQRSRTRSRNSRQSDKTHGSHGSDESINTLMPQPEDAQYLEVAEQIPVSAFGNSLTEFAPSDFSLPWSSRGSLSAMSSLIDSPAASIVESRRRHSDRR